MQVLLGVTQVNPEGKQIVFNGKALSHDYLVLATGSGSTFFGHEDWRTFAPPMKILEHAEEIRAGCRWRWSKPNRHRIRRRGNFFRPW